MRIRSITIFKETDMCGKCSICEIVRSLPGSVSGSTKFVVEMHITFTNYTSTNIQLCHNHTYKQSETNPVKKIYIYEHASHGWMSSY